MKKSNFEINLEKYGEVTDEMKREDITPEEMSRLESVLDWMIKKNAEHSDTTPDAQRRVAELQAAKREILRRFLERLHNMENPFYESKKESQKTVTYNDGKFMVEGGQAISLGQLMTDGSWGMDYYPDPNTVPRRVRKRFYLEQTKRDLMHRFDLQIIEHESSKSRMPPLKREGYRNMRENLDKDDKSGLCAEKMVANFLRKLAYDHDAPFQIIEADAYEDMEQKVDFIIKFKPTMTYRGVGVEEDPKAVGIQFTINPQPDVEEKKARQVALARAKLKPEDMLKDIVLVVMPMAQVSQRVKLWRGKKRPGGPEDTWDKRTKQSVLRGVLQGLLPDEEIERLCKIIRDSRGKEVLTDEDVRRETYATQREAQESPVIAKSRLARQAQAQAQAQALQNAASKRTVVKRRVLYEPPKGNPKK